MGTRTSERIVQPKSLEESGGAVKSDASSGPSRSRRLQGEFAQFVAQDLAHRVAGQGIEEAKFLGVLEAGEPLLWLPKTSYSSFPLICPAHLYVLVWDSLQCTDFRLYVLV